MLWGQLTRLNKNLVRFINRPAHPIGRPHVNAAAAPADKEPASVPEEEPEAMELDHEAIPVHPLIAQLSKCPRNLHELWKEYEFGSGGFKAAKDFTEKERGQIRASITGGMCSGRLEN